MKKTKNILFISNRGVLPIVDGHTRRSYNVLKGLAEKNNVFFLSLAEKPEETSSQSLKNLNDLCSSVEFFQAPPKQLSFGMILRLLRSLFSVDPYTVWRHYSTPFKKRVKELLATNEFDIVHCDILPLCYTVREEINVFRTITDHDVSYLKCLSVGREEKNIFLKAFLYLEAYKIKFLEKRIFNQVDLGIVVSDSDKAVLTKLSKGGKFVVVENGVEIDKFCPLTAMQENNKLVWIGGFNHYSNKQAIVYFLKEIYPLIKNYVKDVNIDIVGGGVTEELEKFSLLDSSIKFAGYVEDPLPFIHRGAIFVAPILSGGGTKLKVIEAMAAGKAIVSTDIGVEGINGVHGRDYLVANNVQEFKNYVIELFENTSLKNSLQKNAREFVEKNYDTRKIAEKLNNIYLTAGAE